MRQAAKTENKANGKNIGDVGERRVSGSGPQRAPTIFYKSGSHQHNNSSIYRTHTHSTQYGIHNLRAVYTFYSTVMFGMDMDS